MSWGGQVVVGCRTSVTRWLWLPSLRFAPQSSARTYHVAPRTIKQLWVEKTCIIQQMPGGAHLGPLDWSMETGSSQKSLAFPFCFLCTMLSASALRPHTQALGRSPCPAKLWACSHSLKPSGLWEYRKGGRG